MLFSFFVISMAFDRCAIKDYLLTYLLNRCVLLPNDVADIRSGEELVIDPR